MCPVNTVSAYYEYCVACHSISELADEHVIQAYNLGVLSICRLAYLTLMDEDVHVITKTFNK